MTFDEWNAEPYARTFEDAWKAGAASRDAEVADLRRAWLEWHGKFITETAATELLREQVTLLRDALGELVALKNLKDRAESAEDSSTNAYCGTEYTARKPAAWKSAKEALVATEQKK